MKVHVALTPDEAAAAPTGIVVDVVRATSTIAQALSAGHRRVLCVPEIQQARALRVELADSVVGGERTDAAVAAALLADAIRTHSRV
jgi:phosphosulfolactate phosphohydrolase-like enzyme